MTSRRSRGLMRVVATIVAALTFSAVAAHAVADDPGARKKKVDQSITATKKDLDQTSAAWKKASAALTATTTKVEAATRDLAAKKKAVVSAQNHQKTVAAQLSAAQAAEHKSEAALASNAKAQTRTRLLVGGVARTSYMAGGLGKFELALDVLTSGKNVVGEMSLADIVMRQQNGVLTQLGNQQAAQKAEDSRLTATRARIGRLKVAADNAVDRARTARAKAARATSDLQALQRRQAAAKKALAKQKASELASLKQQQAESARLKKILQQRALARAKAAHRPASTATAAPHSGVYDTGRFLAAPGPISEIISGFGWRMHPILHVMMLHDGVDYPFPCGTPVYAAAAGDVVQATNGGTAGNFILIDHGYVHGVNLATVYDHLSRFVVRGGHVHKGQLIGYSGDTGRSTGCHLHFGTMVNGQFVNPLEWIG